MINDAFTLHLLLRYYSRYDILSECEQSEYQPSFTNIIVHNQILDMIYILLLLSLFKSLTN